MRPLQAQVPALSILRNGAGAFVFMILIFTRQTGFAQQGSNPACQFSYTITGNKLILVTPDQDIAPLILLTDKTGELLFYCYLTTKNQEAYTMPVPPGAKYPFTLSIESANHKKQCIINKPE